jgi:hypothetical protein
MPSLTSSGSPTFNGDGTCTLDSTGPDILSAPSSLISASQMWFACRIATTFPNTTDPYAGGDLRFFQFGSTDADHIRLVYAVATDVWRANRAVASVGVSADSAGQTFASGAQFTLIAAFDASNVKLSVNGGAFASSVKAAGAIADAAFEVGNRAPGDRAANSKYFWAAAGVGTLSDADAAAIHAIGNTDPTLAALPGTPRFLWKADDLTYLVPIAHDALTRFPAGAGTLDTTAGDRTFTHTPVDDPAGVVLVLCVGADVQGVTGVTYGGLPMELVKSESDITEAGRVMVWALHKQAIPSGPQDVVLQGATVDSKFCECNTVIAATPQTRINATGGNGSSSSANPAVSLTIDRESVTYAGCHHGALSPPVTPAAGCTATGNGDYGSKSAALCRRTTPDVPGVFSIGWTEAADDWAMAAAAIAQHSPLDRPQPAIRGRLAVPRKRRAGRGRAGFIF